MTQLLLVYLESLEIFCFEKRKIWPVLLSVFIFVNVQVVFFQSLDFLIHIFRLVDMKVVFVKSKATTPLERLKKTLSYIVIFISWKLNYGKHFYKLSEYLFCFMYSVSTIHVEIPQIKSDYLIEMLQWNCSFCKQEKNFVNDKIVYVSLNLMNHRILHVP